MRVHDPQQTPPFAMQHTLADVCDEYCLEESTPKANLTKLPRLPVLGLECLQSLRTMQCWPRAGIALDLAQRARALALYTHIEYRKEIGLELPPPA